MFKPLTLTFQPLTLWAQVNDTVALGTDCWTSKTVEAVTFFLLSDTKKRDFSQYIPISVINWRLLMKEGERGVTFPNSSSHCPIPRTSLQQPQSKSSLQRIYFHLWSSPSPGKKRLVLHSRVITILLCKLLSSLELVFRNSNYQKPERISIVKCLAI